MLLVLLGAFSVCAGCASLETQETAVALPPLPRKKELRVGHYVFVTDVELRRDHELLKNLEGLQEHVSRELSLPASPQLVYVYLFSDRPSYERYMQTYFRNLPARRAFFMARGNERGGEDFVVYTYWGERIEEDLRHELTHALLHGVLLNVPMWLDEGLAEYFEVPEKWNGLNYRHLAALRQQPASSWTPDLARLERLTLVKDMSPADYREAWAWVHWMLNTKEARPILAAYLSELRTNREPGAIEQRLVAAVSSPDSRLKQHLVQLEYNTRSLPTLPSVRQAAGTDSDY